jgi:hypothetical protein
MRSKAETPAASILTRTSPARGWGRSSSTTCNTSGPPRRGTTTRRCRTWFMPTPSSWGGLVDRGQRAAAVQVRSDNYEIGNRNVLHL